MQRVQYISQIQGRQYVISDDLLDFGFNPSTPDLLTNIIYHFKKQGIFSEDKALTIEEVASLIKRKQTYVGTGLATLETLRFLSSSEKIKVSEVNGREYRVKTYYISKQHLVNVGKTVLPEKVFTRVEPVEVKTTTTKPKKEIQETFDLFNHELVKVFGESKKLKALNDKRKKDIKKILELEMDNQKLFAGFFQHRKDTDNDYLDFQYILRNPELYLSYSGNKKRSESEEERRARIKHEKLKEQSKAFLNEQRSFRNEPAPVTFISDFAQNIKGID